MYYMEIENFGTGNTVVIEAEDRFAMHSILIAKGFECGFKYRMYAGLDEEGNEIGGTPFYAHAAESINPVNQKELATNES